MNRPIYKALFFILLIALLANCSDSPKRPDKTRPTETAKVITDPAEKRRSQAEQELTTAMAKKQPEKNILLLGLVDFLLEKIPELNLPGEKEYALIANILTKVEQAFLSKQQNNYYLLSHVKVLLSQQQYQPAEVLLQEFYDNNSIALHNLPAKLLIEYHDLRAIVFNQLQQNLSAAKELIKAYRLVNLHLTEKKEQYLLRIWDIINHFQLYQLENYISSLEQVIDNQEIDNEYLQFQLRGWLQLMIEVKSYSRLYQLNQQLTIWAEAYPAHMANHNFIQARLQQRFEFLLAPKQIALLLPGKGRLVKPAQVIINGFLAAHFQSAINNQLILRIYDSSEYPSIWPSYKKALAEGAEVIIGPFEKKHIIELAEGGDLPVPTLTLNHISTDKQNTIPDKLYQFALNPEDEVAIITHQAKKQGLNNAALITPDTKWGKRLELMFLKQWQKMGGKIVSLQNYTPKTYDYGEPIQQLLQLDKSNQRRIEVRQAIGRDFEFTPRRRKDIDVIFLAAFPKQGKQIPLQISYYHGADIPVYATSHIIGKAFDKKANSDLNGITYTDMPWLIDSTIAAISRSSKQKSAAYKRLFSFGVDSYNIIPYLSLMANNSSEQFSGETGLLHISELGYIKRKMPIATIINGQAVVNN
ncbi:MAG: penicillin-binding protein activator [Pseudomonadota bacterium]